MVTEREQPELDGWRWRYRKANSESNEAVKQKKRIHKNTGKRFKHRQGNDKGHEAQS